MKTLLVIALLFFIENVFGAWMIDVELHEAEVLHQLTYDGSSYCCCDDNCKDSQQIYCFDNLTLAAQNCSDDCSCDVNLNLCVSTYDGAAGDMASAECYRSSQIFRNDELFSFFYSPSNERIYSLLQFTGGDAPPPNDTILLNITVTDEDNNQQTPMDSTVVSLTYQVQSELNDPVTYTTDGGIVQVTIAYRVYCATGYYGDRCDNTMDSGTCSVSTSTSTVTVYSNAAATVTPTSSDQQTTEDQLDCVGWRITTVLLIIILVFGVGVCCALCCILVCFWQFKQTKKTNDTRTAGVVTYSANSGIIASGITNPSYEDKMLEEKKQHPMDSSQYVEMNTKGGSINKTPLFPTTTVAGDENYEVMSPSGGHHQRTDFSKLNTPKDLDMSHTYEQVGTLDSNITGLTNDYDDEYNKLKR